jgi:hypothetical protein
MVASVPRVFAMTTGTGSDFCKRPTALNQHRNLIGYVLTPGYLDPGAIVSEKLEKRCYYSGFTLETTEWEGGNASNPIRMGLWKALRRLVCNHCPPKRMPFSVVHFNDFLTQALSPCHCPAPAGLDGLIVSNLNQITSDPTKVAELCIRLARLGKHLITEDTTCLSCCHPAIRRMVIPA